MVTTETAPGLAAAEERMLERWIATFARHTGDRRPLRVLDLGSGTGRFTPALADEFGGPVVGVEPSARARARAAAHPGVRYLDGSARAIPLPDRSCDVALLFMTLHHVDRHDEVFTELARVTDVGATVLIRCMFADRMPEIYWHRFFPTARTALGPAHRTTAETLSAAGAAGFDLVAFDEVEQADGRTIRQLHQRVATVLGADPGPVPPDEVAAGLAEMARVVARYGDEPVPAAPADLLVLRRRGREQRP